jgi:hypothetical protein
MVGAARLVLIRLIAILVGGCVARGIAGWV